MTLRFAERSREAYDLPLTIGHLLDSAMSTARDQEIVYRDQVRFNCCKLCERVGRLASLLTALGAQEGMTVAVMVGDSHRYLEAYFAIPMMGAVLHTVNVRLAPAQIACTLVHAKAEILIVHRDFLAPVDLRQRKGVTFSHCIPTILRMVLSAAARREAGLSGWTIKIGGSALTAALCREGRSRGLVLANGFGMSETALAIAIARWRPGDHDEAAQIAAMTVSGVPIPLASALIVDADMRDLARDGKTQGELVLRAPWLTPCYVGDAAASEALWRGGLMHTQDVATIDADGTAIIRDRLKDMIKTGIACIAEVAVVGVPDARWRRGCWP